MTVAVGPPPITDIKLHYVNSVDKAHELLRWLSTSDRIGCDTEATGLDKRKDKARLVQVGDAVHGWAIPVDEWGGVFRELVSKFDGRYDFHNAPYDWHMIKNRYGIELPIEKIDDTRIAAHVRSARGSIALKNIAKREIHPAMAVGQEQLEDGMRANGWNWETVPVDFGPYWTYGALDPVLTYRIKDIIWPEIRDTAIDAYNLEMAVLWVCDRMEQRGAHVDVEYIREFITEMEEVNAAAAQWVTTHYPISKPGSDIQVMETLLAEGVSLIKRTPSGSRYSVDKEVLESLDHPLAKGVLTYRRSQKIIDTYLNTYLTLAEQNADHLIFPSINTIGGSDKNPFEPGGSKGVRTGRMSMSDPNLQNVPTRTAAGSRIRDSFTARPGNKWIKVDADQIEMRVMAHVSRDPGLIAAFNSPDDFFVVLARELFGDPDFVKSDPRRQMVKNGGYAKIYATGPDTFASTTGVPLHEAQTFMATFDRLYPGVRALYSRYERDAARYLAEHGTSSIRAPLSGRLLTADKRKEYVLVNYAIQGTAAEILKRKIVECDAAGLGEFMMFPVHDELDLDVPEADAPHVLATLNDVLNDSDLLDVPITWSPAVGDRWGSVIEL